MKRPLFAILIVLLASTLSAKDTMDTFSYHANYSERSWEFSGTPAYETNDGFWATGIEYLHIEKLKGGFGWSTGLSLDAVTRGTHKIYKADKLIEITDLPLHKFPLSFTFSLGLPYSIDRGNEGKHKFTIIPSLLMTLDIWTNATPNMNFDFGAGVDLMYSYRFDGRTRLVSGLRASIYYAELFLGWFSGDNSNGWQDNYMMWQLQPYLGFAICKRGRTLRSLPY